jgi:hypothetical protein
MACGSDPDYCALMEYTMTTSNLMDSYDYIVIGGGHNGLSAACTWAALIDTA